MKKPPRRLACRYQHRFCYVPTRWSNSGAFCCAANVRFWHKADIARRLPVCPLLGVMRTCTIARFDYLGATGQPRVNRLAGTNVGSVLRRERSVQLCGHSRRGVANRIAPSARNLHRWSRIFASTTCERSCCGIPVEWCWLCASLSSMDWRRLPNTRRPVIGGIDQDQNPMRGQIERLCAAPCRQGRRSRANGSKLRARVTGVLYATAIWPRRCLDAAFGGARPFLI